MLEYRPCGACGKLVSVETGCAHWKPQISTAKRRGWTKGRARSTSDTATPPGPVPAVLLPGTAPIPCSCDKVPGPPTPHDEKCDKVRAHRVLTARQGAR